MTKKMSGAQILSKKSIKFLTDFMKADEFNFYLVKYIECSFTSCAIEKVTKESKKYPDIPQKFIDYLKKESLESFQKAMFIFDQFLDKDKDLQ